MSNVNASSMNGNGLGADGLIGFPLFADAVTTIDFTNGTLQLQDPNQTHPSKLAGIHAIIDLSSGIPQVPMKIDGRIPVDTFLDTGDPYLVLIPKSLVFQEHLTMLVDNTLGGYFSSHVAVGGVGGRYQIGHCGRLDSIAFGQIVYQNPKTCETTSFIGYRALVGLDFLRHFKRIIFDYPQSRMIFVPKV
uniref:Retroviral aspartyl protease n=1 Tax=mine drainage metagenome TaxID=410659 RepID=E6PC22_9ZZZZ